MSYWSRVLNVFRGSSVNRELDEEMQLHIEEAIANGRDPEAARRAFGPALRLREQSRDVKIATWLDSLRSDMLFGWRQLVKNRTTSGAAILSLALAIGACTAAFRLIDAMLLRPLPVKDPGSLYFLTYEIQDRNGDVDQGDSFEYPLFRQLRAAVKDQAEVLAISYAGQVDLTYGSQQDMEKAHRQWVSGWTFRAFGLQPALGRLLSDADDQKPGAHPYAVISHHYWTRRFGRDPKVLGRTFKMGRDVYEIVGVAPEGFTGTETGTLTDIFTPTMMNARAVNASNWSWFRTWVQLNPNTPREQVQAKLQATLTAFRQDLSKTWGPGASQKEKESYVRSPLSLEPAAAGVSGLQRNYRRSLLILAVVVLLVLLIACANVANLMTAQAASRAREMALRVSIGAGKMRLVQLVLIEGLMLAVLASLIGGMFAWWSAPFVVSMINPPDNPVQLVLPADWRVMGFAVILALGVTLLFGLAPALRASSVKPAAALKGGENPGARQRLMNALIAAQVAFCFLVHLVAGLFIATFDRLSHQPTGFASERVLTLDTVARGDQPYVYWSQVADRLRSLPGVESVGLCSWALMSDNAMKSTIWINHQHPPVESPYMLAISPGWLDTMKVPLIAGRDFRPDDQAPAVALVNEAFAKLYFDGQSPVGKMFERESKGKFTPTQIIGLVGNTRYKDMRETMRPTVFIPVQSIGEKGEFESRDWGTFVVRTAAADPLTVARALRNEVSATRSEFRVSNVGTQTQLVQQHTIRERLLATLSLFFAIVALLLAAVGLYGVLNYSVLLRRREIGIRMALGAPAGDVAVRVISRAFAMMAVGALVGLTVGVVCSRYLETLLFDVKATDPQMLAVPVLTILTAALLAAVPPVIHAVRIEPSVTLRAE